MEQRKKPELLAPAGDLSKLKIAILYGADAVFVGGKKFSLRAKASNFGLEDMKEAVLFAKEHHARIYVTVNIYPHNEDLNGLDEYLLSLDEVGIDAIIASSMIVVTRAHQLGCKFEVHLSTQQSTASSLAGEFWKELGVNRIVLARETTLEQIKAFKEHTTQEMEVFIHGGMCAAFSGRCVLSNNMASRDANRGGCAHSCRWYYDLFENGTKKSGDHPFMFASKDLMALPVLGDLIDIGVDSLKIEGRMKSHHYIATVVGVYRRFIDEYFEKGKTIAEQHLSDYISEIQKCENRSASTGFLTGDVTVDGGIFAGESEQPNQDFIAYVLSYDKEKKQAFIETRNYFTSFIEVEAIQPLKENHRFMLKQLYTEEGESVEFSNRPNQKFYIDVDFILPAHAMIRKVR